MRNVVSCNVEGNPYELFSLLLISYMSEFSVFPTAKQIDDGRTRSEKRLLKLDDE